MVDLRIYVVGPSCQHDPILSRLFQPCKHFLAFFPYNGLDALVLGPGLFHRGLHFLPRQGEALQLLVQPLGKAVFIEIRQKRVHVIDALFPQHVHVRPDDFRIGRDDGAVVAVVGLLVFFPFIGYTRVEYVFDTHVDKAHDMPVDELRRIADRLGRHRFYARFVNFPR